MGNGWGGIFSSDNMGGMLALERKEDLQVAIEEQQAMGLEGLAEEDNHLMEISLGDLETTSEESGLLASCCQSSACNAYSLRRQQAQAAARRSRNNHG